MSRIADDLCAEVRYQCEQAEHFKHLWMQANDELERLKQQHEKIQAAEREACAKVCEDFADGTSAHEVHHRFATYKCADLIRKRGGDENIS